MLAAVANEGFRTLRQRLVEAWEQGGRGRQAFDAMGAAYVHFAITHSSHYRVMFGGFVDASARDPQLRQEGAGAFQALVDALVSLQRQGLVVEDQPLQLAQLIWSTVHGIAMLAIDGQLQGKPANGEALFLYAVERLRTGIAAPQP